MRASSSKYRSILRKYLLLYTQQIKQELLKSQLRVASLQDMSRQLLVNAEGSDCLEAKEKVHVIGNRLKLLLKEVSHHIKDLEKLLDMSSSQQDLSSWSSADELDTSGSMSPTSGRSTPNRQKSVTSRWLFPVGPRVGSVRYDRLCVYRVHRLKTRVPKQERAVTHGNFCLHGLVACSQQYKRVILFLFFNFLLMSSTWG